MKLGIVDSINEHSQDALHNVRAEPGQPLEVDLLLNGSTVTMEVDTGVAVSLRDLPTITT